MKIQREIRTCHSRFNTLGLQHCVLPCCRRTCNVEHTWHPQVRRKCETGTYGGPEDFAGDMRLVFANAHSYNKAGTDVYVMATTLAVRAPHNVLVTAHQAVCSHVSSVRTLADRRLLHKRQEIWLKIHGQWGLEVTTRACRSGKALETWTGIM